MKNIRERKFSLICLFSTGMIAALCVSLQAQTRDWQALFRSNDNTLKGGNGYADNPNGAVLAWNEAYLLKGYVQMYESFHDRYYLRKIVAHFDRMIENLEDWNSDGKLAWGSFNYTDEVLANPSFSECDSVPTVLNKNHGFEIADLANPTLPAGWKRTGTSQDVYRSTLTEDRHEGAAGLVVKTNGVSWRQGIQPILDSYAPEKSYSVSFWGKTNGKVKGRVGVYDRTFGTSILGEAFFSTTDWAAGNLTFTAPSIPGRNLGLYCYFDNYKTTDGVVWFDDVTLLLKDESRPESWTSTGESSANVLRILSNDCPTQPACLEVQGNGQGESSVAEQTIRYYVPGAEYLASVRSNGPGKLEVWDENTRLAAVERSSPSWGLLEVPFKAPGSAGRAIKMRLSVAGNLFGTRARFDDASLKMGTEYLVHQAIILDPVLNFIRLIKEDPRLQTEFKAKADAYQILITDKILPPWNAYWREVDSRGFYVSNNERDFGRPGDTADASLPHNQYLGMVRVFSDLWKLTGNTDYRNKEERMGNAFKSVLKNTTTPQGNPAFEWHYADPLFPADSEKPIKAEDVNHGTIDISAAVRLAEDKIVFTNTDMRSFSNTLLDVVWNGNKEKPAMHSRVNGEDIVGHESEYTYGMFEWILLAQVDPNVWPVIDGLFQGVKMNNGPRLLALSQLARFDPLLNPIDTTPPMDVMATLVSSTAVRLSWNPPTGPAMNANPGFEQPGPIDPTLPEGWTRSGTSTEIFRSEAGADRYSGTAGLVIKTNERYWRQGIQKIIYTPGENHVVTFLGKTNGRVKGRVGVYDRTDGKTSVVKEFFFSNTEWAPMSFTFRAPETESRDLRLTLYSDAHLSDGIVWFDDVQLGRDAVGATGYRVFQDGLQKGTVGETSVLMDGLILGKEYRFAVQAFDNGGNVSPLSFDPSIKIPPLTSNSVSSVEVGANAPPLGVDGARAYPVPFRPGHGAEGMTFDRLPTETSVYIYTIDGQPVRTLTTDGEGRVAWDLTNDAGHSVSSGVYLAIMEKNGGRKELKVVIQK